MKRKEIASNFVQSINFLGLDKPYIFWKEKVEEFVNSSLHCARDNRLSVVATGKEIVNASLSFFGERIGEGIDNAVRNVLLDWYAYGWLTTSEQAQVEKLDIA